MSAPRRCLECGATESVRWREGPAGPKTLCNKCGARHYARTASRSCTKCYKTMPKGYRLAECAACLYQEGRAPPEPGALVWHDQSVPSAASAHRPDTDDEGPETSASAPDLRPPRRASPKRASSQPT